MKNKVLIIIILIIIISFIGIVLGIKNNIKNIASYISFSKDNYEREVGFYNSQFIDRWTNCYTPKTYKCYTEDNFVKSTWNESKLDEWKKDNLCLYTRVEERSENMTCPILKERNNATPRS